MPVLFKVAYRVKLNLFVDAKNGKFPWTLRIGS